MDRVLRESVGDYSSLLELADQYRHKADEVGLARAFLLHAVRSGMLLQWVKRQPDLLSATEPKPQALGISGGLTNLSTLAISKDFASLYAAVLEAARMFVRLCRFTSVRSRAMEDRPGVWGLAVLGIAPDELSKVLDQFQQAMGVPPIERAKVGVTGDRWSTVIGPPSVLEFVIHKCPALKNLPKNELSIHALQHVVTVSQADLEWMVGDSALHNIPILPDFNVWGMDEPHAAYGCWGDLLRAVVLQVLSLPLDIKKVIGQLNTWLGTGNVHCDVKVIGPSSHLGYLASAMKGAGNTTTLHTDKSLEGTGLPKSDRIAIVGMTGRGPGSDNLEEFWNVIMSKQDLCREVPKDRFDIEEFYCEKHNDTCHRQFLMSAYEALEVAGYSDGPDGQTRAVDPKRIAAFYGQANDDWHMVSHYTLGCDAYTLQGAQRAFGAGRIAYHFGWEGPTYSLDSACASSASALHLACMSLLTKDIDMAVVGGANITNYPHSWTSLSKSGVLSDTGNCKTYRDDADGYCRADYEGSIVVKRLEDAVAQNDNILAVVAGSGRNHSGNSTSITTSDAVIQLAVTNFFKHRTGIEPLVVEGVKANIGHSEAAAGMAALLKCLMMLQPKEFKSVDHKPRRILLNNFDAAGGNCCVVIEDYIPAAKQGLDPRPSHVFATSAKTQNSFHANKRNLVKSLRENPDANIQGIAYSTTARRMHHPIRFACSASTTEELINKLELDVPDMAPTKASPIVFVFTVQGSHYAGMGSELYATCDTFRETVDLCSSICEEHKFSAFADIIIDKNVDFSTKDTIQTQLAVVTLEIGLAAFWRSCGIQPSMVMGHSLGEYVALHISGVLSLADVLYLVGHRARMFLERCEAGACAMLAVSAPAAAVQDMLDQTPSSSCTIACINSSNATVVSGTTDDVVELQRTLTLPPNILAVDYGFHSFQMDPMINAYISLAAGVTCSIPKIPVASTVTASIIDTDVCSSFIRSTLSISPSKILPTIEKDTNPWVSISKSLAGTYNNGINIDWLALNTPFTDGLKLLNLPAYSWDMKDYWITYTEANEKKKTLAPAEAPTSQISTCAQYVVQQSSSPELTVVTLGASTDSLGFSALINGHQIRGVSIAPGSVFCDAGLAAAKYILQSSGKEIAENSILTIRDVSLKRPFTQASVDSKGELLTTAVVDRSSSDWIGISWKASSKESSFNIGNCTVVAVDALNLQADWDRVSYFAQARMNEIIRSVKEGSGHRMLKDVFYALFSRTVKYAVHFKLIKEAFISLDFEEVVAEVVLQNDPKGTHFAASPYWGRQYLTYVRVSRRDSDTTTCDVYIFESNKLVMQCSRLRFHEVSNETLDRLLGKVVLGNPSIKPQIPRNLTTSPIPTTKNIVSIKLESTPKKEETQVIAEEEKVTSSTGVFEIILDSIAKATGTKISDLTDDIQLAELGVDSIMGIEIAARANSSTDSGLTPSFMLDYPTIGELRNQFSDHRRSSLSAASETSSSDFSFVERTPEGTSECSMTEEEIASNPSPEDDDSPAPNTRVILLQGRPSSGKQPFYLIADGTGSIATYIHLAPFKSKMPIYGIDSPYLQCPSRYTPEAGIPSAAKFIVEALIRVQPEGAFQIGGFSGGAMLAYEVCRQLAAAGRSVDSLLLIDMCCLRPAGSQSKSEIGWKIYESIASQSGGWDSSKNTQQHLKAIFTNVAAYHPAPMTTDERPKRTAIILAKKGLVDRISSDVRTMDLLAKPNIPTKAFTGFMKDGRMGAIAWGLPHKTDADLGPNGWERFVGEARCSSIDADHLEMPMPTHVHLLQKGMEEAFEYLI
ncbi:hypothetical protein HYALB_00005275 [Hymenoscyphus albidus]|uniref:Polyketide synthase n=1 Tax=Hymenoscyphus albidus TaxID=595503 RepID=A0A9N9LE70_9HELO|nr:hypothetical protein HYALB_00005275 [Hymenoscyphus albidus]